MEKETIDKWWDSLGYLKQKKLSDLFFKDSQGANTYERVKYIYDNVTTEQLKQLL